MSQTSPTIRPPLLSSRQATVISLIAGGGLTLFLLVVMIGFRESIFGLLVLGGMGALALVVLVLLRPALGAYILIFTVTLNLSAVATTQGLPSINKPLIALVAASLLLNRLFLGGRTRRHWRLGRSEALLFAYLAVNILSVVVATDRALALDLALDLAKDIVLILAIIYGLRTPAQWRGALWVLIAAISLVGVLSSYQALSGNYWRDFGGLLQGYEDQIADGVFQVRLGGPIGRANFFGQILVAYLVLLVYRVLDERRWWLRLGTAVAAATLVLATVYTYSRGALVTLLAVLFLIALQRRIRPGFILLTGLVGLVILQLLPAGYTERIDSLTAIGFGADADNVVYTESSLRGRLSEMGAGVLMFVEHPLTGVGLGNYNLNYQAYASRIGLEYRATERDAHSLYFEIAAETGILGVLTFGALIVALQYDLTRARRLVAARRRLASLSSHIYALKFAILSYLISSAFLHGDFFRYFWLLVALAIALIHVVDAEMAREEGATAVA